MSQTYIKRSLEPVLRKASAEFPAVVLTGPRQSGKTTILKHLFERQYRYVSLEPPDIRVAALEDPRSFPEMYPSPVIFDEVQYAPDLLPYIKEKIDTDRHKTGQYLLTGSQNLLLMEKVTESLAGRATMLRLLPLSRRESERRPFMPLPWEAKQQPSIQKSYTFLELWEGFIRGGYPEHAASGPMGGAIMETAVLSEIIKTLIHCGINPQIYFWRTTAGTEVDIVVEEGGKLIPIEVKLSATPRPAMASSIKRFHNDLKDKSMPGYVVHPGDVNLPLGSGTKALPFPNL